MKENGPQDGKRLSIGGLSALTGCNIETIRYYERIGLILAPPRTEGGHRSYDGADSRRLAFIRRCRELGFSIKEIRALLGLVDGGDYTCGEVRDLTLRHVEDVRRKIADLRKLERTLGDIASGCNGGQVPECPIIDALYRAPVTREAGRRG